MSLRHRSAVLGNVAGAAFAGYLLLPDLRFFLSTGRPLALLFALQQLWVGAVFLIRRPARRSSRRALDWVAAYAGWFTSFLVRPSGAPLPLATAGLCIQIGGLVLWTLAFARLARSYGIVAADRGLVTSGPYAVVRHPLYAAYMVGAIGYLMQAPSLWNVAVDLVAVAWQLVRISAEERCLDGPEYRGYRARVRWRLCPGVW